MTQFQEDGVAKPLTVDPLKESLEMRGHRVDAEDKAEWPAAKMSSDLILRLGRVVMDGEGEATLDLHECRAILQLDTAANEAVAFYAPKSKPDEEVDRPMLALRKAVFRAD